MRIVRTVDELRAAIPRGEGLVGLVPTMGALHDGHLSLVRAARERCSVVVVSLFVNPRQFNEASDLAAYPRDEDTDARLAASAGADLLWAPGVEDVYPDGFATTVSVAGPALRLEGEFRGRDHFDGVATVVLKLLLAAGPDVAFFGEKDAQQLAVIRRMVRDLHVPVEIAGCPTVREADGLAMSSRNGRLGAAERERATSLCRALRAAAESRDAAAGISVLGDAGVEPEYLELVDPETFAPADDQVTTPLAVVAARVGDVRLIDCLLLPPSAPPIGEP